MAQRRQTGRWVVAAALALTACNAAEVRPPEHAGKPGAIPSWLPPYTEEQLALLAPSNEPVRAPARRTYPDPTVFRHSHDRLLEDPRAAMKTTKIVADIVSESPHTYTVTETAPRLANDVAQYGPPAPAEPDASLMARRDPRGRAWLVPVKMPAKAASLLEDGRKDRQRGAQAEAVASLREAMKLAPDALSIRLELARSLAASNQLEAAEEEFREALRIDSTLATAHEGLASVLLARGDKYAARISIAHALAYHPFHPGSVAVAAKIAPDVAPRPIPFSIFLEVDPAGVVRVGTAATVGARMYAGCRAVMRYEPELRGALFAVGPEDPYFLSAAEEMFCIESGIGAFVAERSVAKDEGRAPPPDEQTAALLGLAHTEGLLGFVMYETLGRHRPEHARTAPATVHRAMMEYVQRHILGYDPGPNMQNYVAKR